jgi:hypothetical protein
MFGPDATNAPSDKTYRLIGDGTAQGTSFLNTELTETLTFTFGQTLPNVTLGTFANTNAAGERFDYMPNSLVNLASTWGGFAEVRDAAGNPVTNHSFSSASGFDYTQAVIAGDADLDGRVETDDYSLLDRGLARKLTGRANGDFNADGTIDAADYLILDQSPATQSGLSPTLLAARQAQFGPAYTAALLASVPEPASAAAFLVAGLATVACRRK